MTDVLSTSQPYTAATEENVTTVRMNISEGWEQWFLLQSDEHWDNPHCVRSLHRRHHEQALERGAGIFKFGDFFCAMQGKYDPRSSKESIRPEHQTVNYLDALIDTAAEYLRPYASNIVLIGAGNHETSILRRMETDLTGRLCDKLGVQAGGYSGFVRFMFTRRTGGRMSRNLFFHHGSNNGGAVTKGLVGANRRSVYVPDADIICSGHLHHSWVMTQSRVRLSSSGKIYYDDQVHIQLSTYKQEYTLAGGYHVENGREPRPLGGKWIRFFWDAHARGNVNYEIIRAS